MNWVVIVAMLVCMGIGYYAGWLVTSGQAETRDLNRRSEAAEAVIKGRHARSWPLRTTGELAAMYDKPYPPMRSTR